MKVHACEQGSDLWYSLRAGRPTASEFSRIITSTGERSKSLLPYAMELAGELFAGKPLDGWMGNKYTERGKEIEEEARLAYQMRMDTPVDLVGFVTDDQERWGASPDGFVGSEGAVEFKCFPKKHIECLLYYRKHKKCPPDHVQQTQGELYVAEREWVDLVFYQPSLPMLVLRQYRDEQVIKALEEGLYWLLQERDRIFDELQQIEMEAA